MREKQQTNRLVNNLALKIPFIASKFMADNIANLLPPSSIRLSVEPAEVELESSDGSLLFSALQSAFPQSTGVYFRSKECRVMLKFDGRRFLAPAGGWNSGIEYFVELNASRHTAFPFGSYEHASKQFERSVNLVQQMMNGQMGMARKGGRGELTMGPARHHKNESNGPNEKEEEREMERIDEPKEQNARGKQKEEKEAVKDEDGEGKEEHRRGSFAARTLKSMERDFADLARICSGKDAVIDGQRVELDEARKEMERMRGAEREWTEREAEWRTKWEAAEKELGLMRALGRDQEGLQGQLGEMERARAEERAEWERRADQMDMECRRWQREATEWKEKSELGTWTINELSEQLKRAQRERADLQRKTAILEEQVNGEAMEFSRRFQEREKIQQELLADNTRLYQLKDQLEAQCRELREKLAKVEAGFGQKMNTIRGEYEAKEEKLREHLAQADSKMAQMEAKVGALMAEKEKADEQIRRLRNHPELGNSEPLFAYSQG